MGAKTSFQIAAELIRAGRYDEARSIIAASNHPKKHEWLTKLDQLSLKGRLAAARRLVHDNRFDEARALLNSINHPAAHEWLAHVDIIEMTERPPAAPLQKSEAFLYFVIVLISVVYLEVVVIVIARLI